MIKELKKIDLIDWLSKEAKKMNVIVPHKLGSKVFFREFDGSMEVVLDELPFIPAKSILLPPTEELFSFEHVRSEDDVTQEKINITPVREFPQVLLFGVMSCDLKGIEILEHAFSHLYKDPYYLKRRENTIVVSCLKHVSHEACFCDVFSPSTSGADILLAEDGDVFYFEGVTDKGIDFLSSSGLNNTEKPERVKEIKSECETKLREESERFSISGIEDKLDDVFESQIWEELTAQCLGCGICTYVCPTCYCFDIFDEGCGSKCGKRMRTWDTCQSSMFTLEASGHNPRLEQFERYRNRIYHKFKILKDRTGSYGCTGCGRCIKYCPVYVDIREIIKRACKG